MGFSHDIGTPCWAQASVSGFEKVYKVANGRYEEKTRKDGTNYFEKPGGTSFIYYVDRGEGKNWCVGPLLDSTEHIWAERVAGDIPRLHVCKHDRWELRSALGNPQVTVVRPSVLVIEGKGLRTADLNGLSDPYVVFEVQQKPQLKFKTKVIKKNLNPIWRETFEIDGVEMGDELLFTVFDWNLDAAHDNIGFAKLKVAPGGFVGELILMLRGRKAGGIRIELTIPPPMPRHSGNVNRVLEASQSVPKLVEILEDGGDDATQAVGALKELTASEDGRKESLVYGAVRPLVGMLSDSAPESRARAAGALMNLASSGVARGVMTTVGAVQPLLDMVLSGEPGRHEAVGTLLRLCVSEKVRAVVATTAGIEASLEALVAQRRCRATEQMRAEQLLQIIDREKKALREEAKAHPARSPPPLNGKLRPWSANCRSDSLPALAFNRACSKGEYNMQTRLPSPRKQLDFGIDLRFVKPGTTYSAVSLQPFKYQKGLLG